MQRTLPSSRRPGLARTYHEHDDVITQPEGEEQIQDALNQFVSRLSYLAGEPARIWLATQAISLMLEDPRTREAASCLAARVSALRTAATICGATGPLKRLGNSGPTVESVMDEMKQLTQLADETPDVDLGTPTSQGTVEGDPSPGGYR